jgi:hypothetical protein
MRKKHYFVEVVLRGGTKKVLFLVKMEEMRIFDKNYFNDE